jgi:hypothetical protein
MTKDPSEVPGGDGFPEKEDFCFESGPIQLGHLDVTIVSVAYPFMVGPIPFHLGKLFKTIHCIAETIWSKGPCMLS